MSGPEECIACGNRGSFAPFFRWHRFKMVRCECGMVFQRPQPSDEVLEGTYYQDKEFTEALFGELREFTLDNAHEKLEMLSAAGIEIGGNTRALDVGASSGAWLEVASAKGAEATGVELGRATAEAARGRGLDVRTGTLAEAMGELDGKKFSLISFWDVLEHLRDPRKELRMARELLADGGRVAATFPNVEGLYPRLTHRLLARFGVWEYPHLPVHLYDFSPATTRKVFANAGLEVETIRTFATPFEFYRTTSLAPSKVGTGRRGKALRIAFETLRIGAYPLARLTDRGNALFVVASTS